VVFGCRACETPSASNRKPPSTQRKPGQYCIVCLKPVKNIKDHTKKHIEITCNYCPICAAPIENISRLLNHVYCHNYGLPLDFVLYNEIEDLYCYLCDSNSPNLEQFFIHYVRHFENFQDEASVVHCTYCGKQIRRMTLRGHFKSHSTLITFDCDLCDRKYVHASGLNRHIQSSHKGNKKYKCPMCPEVLKSNEALKNHLSGHENPRPFQCHLCGRTFSLQKHLYHHNKYHHSSTDLRKVTCADCGMVFSCVSVLYRHHKTVHLGIKEFQCEVCSVQLSTKHYLKEHLRTHSQDRPIKCEICGKTFQVKANLRQHMKTHKEKCEVCKICDKRFARRGQLISHMQCHERVCQICEKVFESRSDLEKHRAEHI